MPPFELDIELNRKSALDFGPGYESSMESVESLEKAMRASIGNEKYSYQIEKAKQAAEASQR